LKNKTADSPLSPSLPPSFPPSLCFLLTYPREMLPQEKQKFPSQYCLLRGRHRRRPEFSPPPSLPPSLPPHQQGKLQQEKRMWPGQYFLLKGRRRRRPGRERTNKILFPPSPPPSLPPSLPPNSPTGKAPTRNANMARSVFPPNRETQKKARTGRRRVLPARTRMI